MSEKKRYMLDSSVLLHDPNAMFSFEDNDLYIPTKTLEDLNAVTTQPGERGANARDALRTLDSMFSSDATQSQLESDDDSFDVVIAQEMLENPGGAPASRLKSICVTTKAGGKVCLIDTDGMSPLVAAARLNAILVTKSAATRLHAVSQDQRAQDYLHDKAGSGAHFYTGRSIIYLGNEQISLLKQKKVLPFTEPCAVYTVDEDGNEVEREKSYLLSANEFLVIKNASSPSSTFLARYDVSTGHGELRTLIYGDSRPFDVTPRNFAQRFAIEALMQPWEKAPLVILLGPAGTSKTFLSMACGLQQVVNKAACDCSYKSILAARPNAQLDEGIGYLPGSEVEKVEPLMRPIFDNINALMPTAARSGKDDDDEGEDNVAAVSPSEILMARGYLSVQAMTFMRGRSVENTFIVIDEAQNATPQQLFTLVTRVARGTKIVLLGDVDQIDNPYLDRYSNGLTFVSERMRGSNHCWQLTFRDAESERSELAAEAIQRLSH